MAQIRPMHADEAERVRDLWMQACAEMGTPLPEKSARQILANLQQYPAHQDVLCLVVEEQGNLIGFLTCSVTGHPVEPGLSGEIEELQVQANLQQKALQAELVRQAVVHMQAQGATSIHTRIGIEEESPEESEQRAFWQSLGWENDMTIYSIYGSVPGDPALQHVWDEYQA
jgi:ribosomal protein S18 acetylase RimI-like enzyme